MRYNLFAPQEGPLPYPHHTKFADGVAHVVTHPHKLIGINDVIYCNINGHDALNHKVVEVIEQRTARGEHSVDFVPVFQKLRVKNI